MNKIAHDKLKAFACNVFIAMGCPPEEADLASGVLISSDLRGIDSHGVARLSGYVRLWQAKRINVTPHIQKVHETPSTATVDGDSGLGLVVAPRAMEIAIQKAKEAGSGWVAVRNSNHFGIAAYHAMLALQHDMIGIAMTNASPLVAPTYAVERLLGTNPMAFAIPADEEPPFVADLATTTVANGKLEILQRQDKKLPPGWAQDADGEISADPYALKKGGALLPLGSEPERSSHKGYALGAVVDIFSAVLSGANYGPWVPPFVHFLQVSDDLVGEGIGHFLGAMRIDAFRESAAFKKHMDQWIRRFREAETMEGYDHVLIPGDPEREKMKERLQEGIPLLPPVVNDLQQLADEFGLELI